MRRSKGERVVAAAFAILAVVAIWQLDLSNFLHNFATGLGIKEKTPLYNVIVAVGIPIVLVSAARFAIWLYDHLLWPLWPWSGCRRGWWIYGLLSERTDETKAQVAGRFYLNHTPAVTSISEGRAYYVEKGDFTFRGDWNSDVVWISENQIHIVHTMRGGARPPAKARPSQYNAYVTFTRVNRKPIAGREV